MMQTLVEKYRMGMITDNHLVVQSLHMVDPANPDPVLSPLPEEILRQVRQFAKDYLRGRMVTNYGPLPAQDQVHAALEWLDKRPQPKAHKSA